MRPQRNLSAIIPAASVVIQTTNEMPTPPEYPDDGHLERAATNPTGSLPTQPAMPPSAPPTPDLQKNPKDFSASLMSRVKLKWNRTYPPYADSFGPVKFEQTSKPGPGLVVWFVAAGSKVDRIWCLLHGSLLSLIHSSQESLESQRPQGTKSTHPTYALECYLMGPDQDHATPCICVLSEADWYRKAICVLVKEGARHLLNEHKFRCRGVRNTKPQSCTSPRRLSDAEMKDFRVFFQDPQSKEANGRMIEIFHRGVGIGKATVGGVVEIDGQLFGMTVRHAFMMPTTSNCETDNTAISDDGVADATDFSAAGVLDFDSDESDYEDDIDDNNEDSSLDCDMNVGYIGDWVRDAQVPTNDGPVTRVRSDDLEANQLLLRRAKQLPENAALVALDSDLDWALTRLPETASNKHFSSPFRDSLPERVQIKMPNTLLEADIRTKGIFGIHNLLAPQPVVVASLVGEGPRLGASGSWAMKVADGDFVGMLIGSSPSLGSVYILPFQEVFGDISQHMGVFPTVPIVSSSSSRPSPSSDRSRSPFGRSRRLSLEPPVDNLLFGSFGIRFTGIPSPLSSELHSVSDEALTHQTNDESPASTDCSRSLFSCSRPSSLESPVDNHLVTAKPAPMTPPSASAPYIPATATHPPDRGD
ncbi:hypothetical protein VTJ83DRAFT_223 [Remersonia thermophila]|uniref:Uncharacterized protein n=1 Tax=Remersonia thermophila TaxID=72144 RepID=A0ABR4DKN9_9PEZI